MYYRLALYYIMARSGIQWVLYFYVGEVLSEKKKIDLGSIISTMQLCHQNPCMHIGCDQFWRTKYVLDWNIC